MDEIKQESKVKKAIFAIPGSFLVILIPTLMVLIFLGGLISFAWPHTEDFSTRIIFPIFSLGTLISVILCPILLKNLYKTETFLSNKKLLLSFILTFTIPLLLIMLYSVLSPDQRLVYLEGITPQSCETGRPSVPWGKTIEKNRCWASFGMCEKISFNGDYDDLDFYLRSCLQNKSEIPYDYGMCDKFTGSPKNTCLLDLARVKKDLNYCDDMTGWARNAWPGFGKQDCINQIKFN